MSCSKLVRASTDEYGCCPLVSILMSHFTLPPPLWLHCRKIQRQSIHAPDVPAIPYTQLVLPLAHISLESQCFLPIREGHFMARVVRVGYDIVKCIVGRLVIHFRVHLHGVIIEGAYDVPVHGVIHGPAGLLRVGHCEAALQ